MDRKMLGEINEIVKSEDQRGYPSSWHADKESQRCMEISAVRNWASEINKQGHSIHEIEENPDDPPDCIARMDGKRIGVEVTEFTVDENERKEYVRAKDRSTINLLYASHPGYDDKINKHEEKVKRAPPKVRVPNPADWPFDKFHKKLAQIVCRKDKKMHEKHKEGELICVDKYFLLIVIDELNLWEERLIDYLNKIELPKPKHFDAIYVMSSYIPNHDDAGVSREWNSDLDKYDYKQVGPNIGKGHYPVFKVCLS